MEYVILVRFFLRWEKSILFAIKDFDKAQRLNNCFGVKLTHFDDCAAGKARGGLQLTLK